MSIMSQKEHHHMGLGLSSAIHIAKMGMGAAEKTINVSGNNLANSNTIGFKSERADFTSFLSYNYRYGVAPGQIYTAGTNPIQIGMGVEMAGVTTDFSQGAFKDGMSNSDIAINGNGFLVVSPGNPAPGVYQPDYFTRNGVLKINENSDLTTNNGYYVMGYGVDSQFRLQKDVLRSLSIPVGELHIAKATENVRLEGILNAVGDSGTQGTVLKTKQMTDLSKTYPENQKLSANQITVPAVVDASISGQINAGGNVEVGNYFYRYVFVDAKGIESDFSAPIKASVSAGQNSLKLTDLPDVPENYSSLRIYRAVDPGNQAITPPFYRVGPDIDPKNTNPPKTFVDLASMATISDPTNPNYKMLDQGRLNGSYQYYVTYIDNFGNESRPSTISQAHNVNGGQLLLSNIPTISGPNPDDWTGRRIYRCTADDLTSFYLVDEVPNMDPAATVIDRIPDAELVSKPELSWAGRGNNLVNAGTKLVDVGQFEQGQVKYAFDQGVLTIHPTKGATSLRTETLEITNETTVSDFLKFLNESYGIRNSKEGIPPDEGIIGSTINGGSQGAAIINGSFYLLGNSGEQNALELKQGDLVLTTAKGKSNVDLGWLEVQKTAGVSVATDLQVFDSLGAPVSVLMTFVLESKSNTETIYRWYADSPDNQPAEGSAIATGTGTLKFDQNGRLVDASDTTISVERTEVASVSPASFQFQMQVDALKALAAKAPVVTQTFQDGDGTGTLIDYAIQKDGTITGIFSSGATKTLGQIVLATFTNQEGLHKVGDSLFRTSSNSGDPKIGEPGEREFGSIRSNSLEQSNADIGAEIVNMILASAMYRANAKVMTTSNDMYDALLRII
ncbi:MAG: flagellar hook-basal body complex protein [Thermoguttaceae bacterium]